MVNVESRMIKPIFVAVMARWLPTIKNKVSNAIYEHGHFVSLEAPLQNKF